MMRAPEPVAKRIATAGALFLGNHPQPPPVIISPAPAMSCRLEERASPFSGLTGDQFRRRNNVVKYSPKALKNFTDLISTLADGEGLEAQRQSVEVRGLMQRH